MATFTDTIRLVLNLDVDKSASGGLKSLKTDIENADGAWGKMKVGASGAFDFVKANAAGFATAGAAAIAGFAASSIKDFEDVALKSGELSDALGISVEDASRWVEVAGDLGIGADKLETSMGKMLKVAGSSPETFDKLGVSIIRAKDGSVDANATFLSVIDRLNGMKDPAERAAAAQQLLGKSWMDSAELIGLGADGVKARLAEVSGAKIMSADQRGEARDFRDAMDDLGDRVDNLKLQFAKDLVPALTALADVVGPVIDGFGQVRDAAEKIGDIPFAGWIVNNFIHPLDRLKTAFHLLPTDDEIHDWIFGQGASDISAELAISPETLATWDKQRAAGQALQLTTEANTAAYTEMGAGLHKLAADTEAYNQTVSSADFGKAAIEGALTANHDYTDQLFALKDVASDSEKAIDDFGDSMKNADGKVDHATLTFDANTESGRKQIDALKGISNTLDTQFASAYADAHGDMGKFMSRADTISNDTLNRLQSEFGLSDDQVNDLRASLGLTAKDWQARFEMDGTEEARVKIGLLQGSISDLPKDVQTRVNQSIIKGDFVGALNEIQGYYNRNPVTVKVNAVPSGYAGVGVPHASGGVIGANEPISLVGEQGPELVSLPAGSRVHTAGETRGIMSAGGGGGTSVTFAPHIEIKSVAGNPYEIQRMVMDALAGYVRSNGAASVTRLLKLA